MGSACICKKRMSRELIEVFEKRSANITGIYDVKLSGKITDVYEDLVSGVGKVTGERSELEGRY